MGREAEQDVALGVDELDDEVGRQVGTKTWRQRHMSVHDGARRVRGHEVEGRQRERWYDVPFALVGKIKRWS